MSESNIKEGQYCIRSVAYPTQVVTDIIDVFQGLPVALFRDRKIQVPQSPPLPLPRQPLAGKKELYGSAYVFVSDRYPSRL